MRRAGILIADYPSIPQKVQPPRPTFSTEELNPDSCSDSPSQEPVPWLGPSPPRHHRLSPAIGQERGKYRLWCLAPAEVSSITIYQHTTPDWKIITIGLEFNIRPNPDSASLGKDGLATAAAPANAHTASVLLGHRTLFMKHSTKIDLEPGEKIIGFTLTAGDPSLQVSDQSPWLRPIALRIFHTHCESMLLTYSNNGTSSHPMHRLQSSARSRSIKPLLQLPKQAQPPRRYQQEMKEQNKLQRETTKEKAPKTTTASRPATWSQKDPKRPL